MRRSLVSLGLFSFCLACDIGYEPTRNQFFINANNEVNRVKAVLKAPEDPQCAECEDFQTCYDCNPDHCRWNAKDKKCAAKTMMGKMKSNHQCQPSEGLTEICFCTCPASINQETVKAFYTHGLDKIGGLFTRSGANPLQTKNGTPEHGTIARWYHTCANDTPGTTCCSKSKCQDEASRLEGVCAGGRGRATYESYRSSRDDHIDNARRLGLSRSGRPLPTEISPSQPKEDDWNPTLKPASQQRNMIERPAEPEKTWGETASETLDSMVKWIGGGSSDPPAPKPSSSKPRRLVLAQGETRPRSNLQFARPPERRKPTGKYTPQERGWVDTQLDKGVKFMQDNKLDRVTVTRQGNTYTIN